MTIREPSLRMRCALFFDHLRLATGQGLIRLERRIRENQYEAFGLTPPAINTVSQWFKLQRPVAFEHDRLNDHTPPWLLAAELEIPGSSFFFFHPLVDLLYGEIESSEFWSAQLTMIPQQWIDDFESKGYGEEAEEYRAMNESKRRRLHRRRPARIVEPLDFVQMSLLRLPMPMRSVLFEQNPLGGGWRRSYGSAEEECAYFAGLRNLDALAALVGLLKEAALIHDFKAHAIFQGAVRRYLPLIKTFADCRRVGGTLAMEISSTVLSIDCPEYQRLFHHGFGIPASWRSVLNANDLPGEQGSLASEKV